MIYPSLYKTMKKQFLFSLFVLALFLFPAPSYAQSSITAVSSLSVELWPDYDRPAVLVLFTGTLPDNTPLPATVVFPLPDNADLNVVARITTAGNMVDDLQVTNNIGSITFSTSDSRFRVEYYHPYTVEGDQHQYNFSWQADFAVESFKLAVQQPVSATALQLQPTAVDIFSNTTDGFTYHALSDQPLPANQPYTAQVRYTMGSPQLSREQLPPASNPASVAPAPVLEPTTVSGVDWPLILIGVGSFLITIAVTWQLATYRATRSATATSASKPPASKTRFCRECGSTLRPKDRFCRECGTAVKP